MKYNKHITRDITPCRPASAAQYGDNEAASVLVLIPL